MPCLPLYAYPTVGGIIGVGAIAAIVYCVRLYRRDKARGSRRRGRSKNKPKRPRGAAAGDPKALPEGWEEHEDDDGHVFYHNELTSETTWSRPRPTKRGEMREVTCTRPTVRATGPGAPAPALLYGWEEHTDDDGQRYYYHPRERRTTWTLPEGVSRV